MIHPIANVRDSVGRGHVRPLVLIGVVAALGLMGIVALCAVIVAANQMEIAKRQRQILYKTNPNAVLAACATIRAKQAAFAGNPDWHPTPPKGSNNPDPADPQMPPVIGALQPSTISILPEGVRIELGGGFYRYGLAEQLPGAPKPALAVKQLVPGLW
jgi:hypothetical protein